MKSQQVGFVLMTLILIGIVGMAVRLLSSGSDDFVMEGLMPITSDVINKVTVERGNQKAELVRLGPEDWRVGKHNAFTPTLNNFWTHVADLTQAQLVSRNPQHHQILGVDEDNGTLLSFYRDQSIQEGFLIGKWSPDVRLCYIRKSGKDEVYGIPCPRNGVFSPNVDSWRNPIVLSVVASDIASFDFIYPDSNKTFSVKRAEDGEWTVQSDSLSGSADLRVVDALLQAVSVVPALGFEEDLIAERLDFDAPDGAVRINTIQNSSSPTTRLKFLGRDEQTSYVKTPSQSTVFIVDSRLAEFLLMSKEEVLLED
mgnify:CR=1 FL=1